jgi:hypothetical protein
MVQPVVWSRFFEILHNSRGTLIVFLMRKIENDIWIASSAGLDIMYYQ